MSLRLVAIAMLALPVCAEDVARQLEAEIATLDARAADPQSRFLVASAVAEHLGIHRNRLVLLSKQTGNSYGRIFRATLEQKGHAVEEMLARARSLNQDIERRLANPEHRPSPVRPVLYFASGIDHNSAGTFYSVVPQLGIESSRGVLVLGAPFYQNSGPLSSAGGIGDLVVSGYITGSAGRLELGAGLSAGLPTGDSQRGLGAGKVTADGYGMLGWRLEKVRLFVSPGIANSVFSNVAYQRPYISDGNAAHLSGGIEFRPVPRWIIGAGGFAVRPFGSQSVISRVSAEEPQPAAAPSQPRPTPPGRGKGLAKQRDPGQPPVFERGTPAEVVPADLRDHGPNLWTSVYLHPALSLNLSVARSVPFRLTSVRIGLGFDAVRLLFPRFP